MNTRTFFYFDTVLLYVSFLCVYILRSSFDSTIQQFSFYAAFIFASLVLFLGSGLLFSLYRANRVLFSLSYLSDFLRTFFLWALCIMIFPFLTKTDYSRAIVFLYIVVSFLVLYLIRFAFMWTNHTNASQDSEITNAAHAIVTMVQVTQDPLSLLESIRIARSSRVLYRITKRLFDVIAASLAGILLSPLWIYLIVKIRRDTPGPVLFTQDRVGKDGKKFTIYKFRTMYSIVEKYADSPRGDSDSRVTRVGATLRRYSLDELPQLLNVVRGEMSLVGPRPEMPFIVETYATWQQARLRSLPGLTGLWQILGRKDLPLAENLEYDLYYVFNQSLFLDCAILLKTLPHLILPKGAY